MSSTQATLPKQTTLQTDDEDDDQQHFDPPPFNSRLSVEPSETRQISVPEAIGLNFNSFIPQADITSQVHFFSNVQADSQAGMAGVTDGDRIMQINGVNVTNLEHEDVRKLMQLMTPIVLTVVNDPKYLLLLQEPVQNIEEKLPELPVVQNQDGEINTIDHQMNRFELAGHPSIVFPESTAAAATAATAAAAGSSKSHRCQTYTLTQSDESSKEEPLKAKLCHLRKSTRYDGFGLVLKYQQHLHVIGEVEEASPSYRAGLRENDVIIFVGKINVEKLQHDDVKVMIRATTLSSNQVDLTVISKADIPRYKTLQEKGLVDWSVMNLEK